MAEVLPFSDPRRNSEPSYLEVVTYPSPLDKRVPIATITWVTVNAGARVLGDTAVSFRTLKNREQMTPEAAIAFAKEFADVNRVRYVFHNPTR